MGHSVVTRVAFQEFYVNFREKNLNSSKVSKIDIMLLRVTIECALFVVIRTAAVVIAIPFSVIIYF